VISLTPQDALDLPIDELALHVLADLTASNEWHEYNYTLKYSHDIEHGYSANKAAQQVIAEAMGWLRSL
jgi:hypothetical protein